MGCNGDCPDGISRTMWVNIVVPTVNRLKKACEGCSSTDNLDVHHNKYQGAITISDLMLLCRSCHKKEHNRLKKEGIVSNPIYTRPMGDTN